MASGILAKEIIHEKPARPFRCLEPQYRRELVRVYLTNVEGICRRFLEEKRETLAKLQEDKEKWSDPQRKKNTTPLDIVVPCDGTFVFRIRSISDDFEVGPWSEESVPIRVST